MTPILADIIKLLNGRSLTLEEGEQLKHAIDVRTKHYAPTVEATGEPQHAALEYVIAERRRQDKIFPDQVPGTPECDHRIISVITEEALELVRADQEAEGPQRYAEEATHLAAVAVKLLEHIQVIEGRLAAGKPPYMNRIEARLQATGLDDADRLARSSD